MPPLIPSKFRVVLCTCRHCGWFRVLGYTGTSGETRALIRLRVSPSPVNLLAADVLLGPKHLPLSQLAGRRSGFRDLHEEARTFGLYPAARRFDPLLADRPCPRCKRAGGPGVIWVTWPALDLERHRSWRLIHWPA